ncbi:MAG: YkvA family protein [Aestuariivirgaceae bacterium]|nr:YkvA family protein [Aestuariivirgaceae bacterium]
MVEESTIRAKFWGKLKQNLARVPFAETSIAAFYCALDPQTPLQARGTLLAALAYFILPFDAVPDMLLGLGFTDDMAVLMAAAAMIGNHLKPEHRDRAKAALARLQEGQSLTE